MCWQSWEGGVHVPAFIVTGSGEGLPQGAEHDTLFHVTDIFPVRSLLSCQKGTKPISRIDCVAQTLARLAGASTELPGGKTLDGVDQWPR